MAGQELLTVGQIADRLSEPPGRVAYVIAKHRLKPLQRVGILRLFDADQVITIKEGLYDMRIHERRH
jgi:hypothetical protein